MGKDSELLLVIEEILSKEDDTIIQHVVGQVLSKPDSALALGIVQREPDAVRAIRRMAKERKTQYVRATISSVLDSAARVSADLQKEIDDVRQALKNPDASIMDATRPLGRAQEKSDALNRRLDRINRLRDIYTTL